jgi:acetone carboxylase gamma subunit
MKECPMCGELMRLSERQIEERLPGQAGGRTRQVREWVCPECDYFEEVESGEQ